VYGNKTKHCLHSVTCANMLAKIVDWKAKFNVSIGGDGSEGSEGSEGSDSSGGSDGSDSSGGSKRKRKRKVPQPDSESDADDDGYGAAAQAQSPVKSLFWHITERIPGAVTKTPCDNTSGLKNCQIVPLPCGKDGNARVVIKFYIKSLVLTGRVTLRDFADYVGLLANKYMPMLQ